MNLVEYFSYDGVALAELVRRKAVSPAELLDTALRALEVVNPTLNAVIGQTPEEAGRAVANCDRGAAFAGVPFLLKDIGAHFADTPCQMGSRFFRDLKTPTDSELAARFRRAGLVTLGRTNTPELGCNLSTEPVLHGPTHNPWNLEHSPGGSSGGSAAAVAAGVVPLAHANDGAGSIRAPASACALVGLKPSRGRQPTGPDLDELVHGLGNELVVSRSVRDTAVAMDVTCAPERGSRLLLPAPGRSYLESSTRDPQRLRIAFCEALPDILGTDPECQKAVRDAAQLCAKLGHEVFEGKPDLRILDGIEIWLHFTSVFVAKAVCDYERALTVRASPETLEASVWKIFQMGKAMDAMTLAGGFDRMKHVSMRLADFFGQCDLWLTPTMTQLPPKLGYLDADDDTLSAAEFVNKWAVLAGCMPLFNVSGQPAITLPLAQSASGLPIGVHFAARLGEEATLISLAGQIERAEPWIARRPALSVVGVRE
jgi:amidase